jgi:hypothetical protein
MILRRRICPGSESASIQAKASQAGKLEQLLPPLARDRAKLGCSASTTTPGSVATCR